MKNRPDKLDWAFRISVGVVSLGSLALGAFIPGSIALAAGMLGYLLVPLILHLPVGVHLPVAEGVRIVTGPTPAQKFDGFARSFGAYAWLAYGGASLFGASGLMIGVFALLFGNACALSAFWGLGARVLSAGREAHSVTLERTTLTLRTASGTHVLSYAELGEVEAAGTRIWLSTPTDRHVVEITGSPQLTTDIAASIVEAKTRAGREEQPEGGSAKELERPSGMSAREWLTRIDALAAAARATGPYRGTGLDEDALWALLSDDAADGAVRAAAARVLASSENREVRVRVASSAKAIADPGTRIRVEVAMKPDADDAAAELEALEMEELRKTAGV